MNTPTLRRLAALEHRRGETRKPLTAVILFNDDPLPDAWQGRPIIRLTTNVTRRLENIMDGDP